jgi:hypothetical protein
MTSTFGTLACFIKHFVMVPSLPVTFHLKLVVRFFNPFGY